MFLEGRVYKILSENTDEGLETFEYLFFLEIDRVIIDAPACLTKGHNNLMAFIEGFIFLLFNRDISIVQIEDIEQQVIPKWINTY